MFALILSLMLYRGPVGMAAPTAIPPAPIVKQRLPIILVPCKSCFQPDWGRPDRNPGGGRR